MQVADHCPNYSGHDRADAGDRRKQVVGIKLIVLVGHLVPTRFEAYCRILQPAQADGPEKWWRWSKVTEIAGITSEPGFVRRLHNTLPGNRLRELGIEPLVGEMHLDTIEVFMEHFLALTPAEAECLFYFWSGRDIGRGMRLAEARKRDSLSAPLERPEEKLYRGPLAYMSKFVIDKRRPETYYSPSACWPKEMTWLFAIHTDAIAGYVGGPKILVNSIVEDDRLEATHVSLETKVDDWTDWLPLPGPSGT